MRLVPSILLAVSITTNVQAATVQPDYYAPRAGLDADQALLLDAWSGKAETIAALRHRLEAAPPASIAAKAWSFLCDFDYHGGFYAQAETDCGKAVAADPKGGDDDTLAVVAHAKGLPPPSASGGARVPVTNGAYIPVRAGTYADTAIADTGAQIAVMMQSVAHAAGVRMLGVSKKVNNTTGSVNGEIGLLPRVDIGNATIRNIPVLVLPDAQLTITHDNEVMKLPFILSLYAMAKFGHVAFLDHGKWLALGNAAPGDAPDAVALMWHPLGIAVPLDGPGGRHAAHFDSGANVTYLYDAALPLVSDAERAAIVEGKRELGGVSGVVTENIRKLPVASFTLAGQPFVLRDVVMAKEPGTGEAARLGDDVLSSYAAVIFNFDAMRFSVLP